MGTSELAVVMIRPGNLVTAGIGPEHAAVDADRHDGDAFGSDPELGRDVAARRLRHRHDPRDLACDAGLHADEAVPAPQAEPPLPAVGVGHVELAIDRDRMVDRRQHRPAVPHHARDAPSEALVVVHEVELAEAPGQQAPRPEAEGERLGEPAGAHESELEHVDRRGELA